MQLWSLPKVALINRAPSYLSVLVVFCLKNVGKQQKNGRNFRVCFHGLSYVPSLKLT